MTAHFDVSSAKLLMNEMDEGRGEVVLGVDEVLRRKVRILLAEGTPGHGSRALAVSGVASYPEHLRAASGINGEHRACSDSVYRLINPRQAELYTQWHASSPLGATGTRQYLPSHVKVTA